MKQLCYAVTAACRAVTYFRDSLSIPYTASAPTAPLTNTTTALHFTDSQWGHSDFMIFWVVTVLLRLADEYNNLGLLGNNREDISSYYFKII